MAIVGQPVALRAYYGCFIAASAMTGGAVDDIRLDERPALKACARTRKGRCGWNREPNNTAGGAATVSRSAPRGSV